MMNIFGLNITRDTEGEEEEQAKKEEEIVFASSDDLAFTNERINDLESILAQRLNTVEAYIGFLNSEMT